MPGVPKLLDTGESTCIYTFVCTCRSVCGFIAWKSGLVSSNLMSSCMEALIFMPWGWGGGGGGDYMYLPAGTVFHAWGAILHA